MASTLALPEFAGIGDGLSSAPAYPPGPAEAPRPTVFAQPRVDAIDRLVPNSTLHATVLNYLLSRIDASERHMRDFYARWRVNEMKMQAYINLPKWEEDLRKINNANLPPIATRIIVPYTFATISTLTTYLLHVFAGQRPIFPVSTWKDETVMAARMMEMKLQYDADHTRLIRNLHQFLQDSQVYGLGVMRCLWKVERALRTRRRPVQMMTLEGLTFQKTAAIREQATVYEGNEVFAQDPFLFFPDPRVPMAEVAQRGEFVWWRNFEGRHMILREEADGVYKWVKYASVVPPRNEGLVESGRSILSKGNPHPGISVHNSGWSGEGLRDSMQLDQGTIEIIPRELGLGEGTRPEKWLFTILNKSQIIQAAPFDADHGMHPVAVTEPYTLGYGFGQPGMADYLAPLQDVVSWFFNSHIDNVRKSLNDMFVVDPSMIELQDMKNPEPGKLIRLKRTALGQDVRMAVQQLQVQDVTKQHTADAQDIIRLGQLLSGVNDNVLGVQDAGGRKTATEIRQASGAAASRLAAMSRIISAQGITGLSSMMSLNNQQYLSEDFYIQIMGREGVETPLRVTPDQLVGDFYFPVNDGTLPSDKIALLDVWREIFLGVMNDPLGELRTKFSLPRIFEYIAELGGAKNIENFRIGVVPDDSMAAGIQQGNVVPIQMGRGRGGAGTQNALPSQSEIPGARAVNAL